MDLARSLWLERKYAAAIEATDEAERWTHQPGLVLLKVRILEAQRSYGEALAELDRGMRYFPDMVDLQRERAKLAPQ